MAISMTENFTKTLAKVWLFDDSRLEAELGLSNLISRGEERIDYDWWEPTARWRRENAERRDWFGGEEFGEPKPPVEAPWNRARLQRELDWAVDRRKEMELRVESAREEEAEAHLEESKLRTKLEQAQP